MPSPVSEDTGTIGASASVVPVTRSRTPGGESSVVVDEVALVSAMTPARDAEHVEDLQVLLGLRLPSFVGGHDEQHQRHGSDAGEHVADEPFVARDVDEADLAAARKRAPRVPEVDRRALGASPRPTGRGRCR